jgi:hypothetical protein
MGSEMPGLSRGGSFLVRRCTAAPFNCEDDLLKRWCFGEATSNVLYGCWQRARFARKRPVTTASRTSWAGSSAAEQRHEM